MSKPKIDNPSTLVAVCGYAGDSNQVRALLPYMLHHQCPVVVLSPKDAPILSKHVATRPELTYLQGGLKGYIGQVSLDRQVEHLKLLLTFPHEYFLVNDSDSVVLTPHLPRYLYKEPNVVWSNIVSDEMHPRDPGYSFPRLAFQPPYFLNRKSVQALVDAAPKVETNPRTPFIDWCMMAWSVAAGLAYKGFPDGASCGTTGNSEGLELMSNLVRNHGRVFIHSVKEHRVIQRLAWDRVAYKKKYRIL
jgi:hypothetical protein